MTQSEYTVYGAQWPVSGSWCQCYPLARPPGGYSPNSAQPGAPRKSLRYPPDRTTLADLFFQQTNLFSSSSILLPLFPSSSILFSLFCSVVLYRHKAMITAHTYSHELASWRTKHPKTAMRAVIKIYVHIWFYRRIEFVKPVSHGGTCTVIDVPW